MTNRLRIWLNTSGIGLLSPLAIVLLLAFIAPVLIMFPTSLHPYTPGVGIGEGWTLENYVEIFSDSYYHEVILRSLGMAFSVMVFTIIIGYPLAYFLARMQSRARNWLVLLVIFPLLLNLVVRSFGWIALLSKHGLINDVLISIGMIDEPLKLIFNLTGLIIGMTHIFLPFMVLLVMGAIQNIPVDLEEAAAVLGSSRARVFFSIILPLSVPGLLSGSILVFILSISALVTPRLLGGPTYKVISTLIYDEFMQLLNWPAGSALAFILTLIVLVVIWATGRFSKRWMAHLT
jgi:putative spermidine/putrescine transport system permease protein